MVFATCWIGYFGALQWSVVRFRLQIVLILTACALALAWWLLRRRPLHLTPLGVGIALVGSAIATMTVPLFSYLEPRTEFLNRATFALAALAVGGALAARRSVAAMVIVVASYVAIAATTIVGDPAPKIDVWVTLQQASDALGRGENFYAMTWINSPGIQDAFTYLPWTTVLLAPGRWIAGDVRWAQLVWTLVLAFGCYLLARGPDRRFGARPAEAMWRASAVVALLLFAPGTITQIDQAWTEPLLLAGIVWWALLVHRGQPWWAIIPLALACASKQHLAVIALLVMFWRPFGWQRTLATGALTGALISPWVLASPRDFFHDTLTLLVNFHPIRFANTWYLVALNRYDVTLPFWLTGLVVLGAVAVAVGVVARRQPPLPELLRWMALVLLVSNLVNKQAFYNQFWLSGGLIALSFLTAPATDPAPAPAQATDPAPAVPTRWRNARTAVGVAPSRTPRSPG